MDSPITREPQIFSDHERDVTGYLFAKLAVLYANAFYLVYPSLKESDFAKREYAKQIGRYSRDQIDMTIKHLAALAISRERHDLIYREPNIPAILALMDQCVKRHGLHKQFDSAYDKTTGTYRLEDQTSKAKRYEIGQREASKLLAMFPDEEPKLDVSENTEFAKARLELAKQRLSEAENNNIKAENRTMAPP